MVAHSSYEGLIGTTMGKYRLEKLGEIGAIGPLFIARDSEAGKLYRLRMLIISAALPPEERIVYLGRFQKEANQAASLEHPSILPLVDYGMHPLTGDIQGATLPYLVSPFIAARALHAQPIPLDALLVGRYLDQITAALTYAHERAILHGSLSVENILIKQDGALLVADFGVKRMLELSVLNDAKAAGGIGVNEFSTPAPEQLLGQTCDTYTDVYALAAVLYYMLTGHRVFRGKTSAEIIQQHLQASVPSLKLWRSDLPGELDRLLMKAMAKEPTQRYRQPGELADAYHALLAPNDRQRVPFFVGTDVPDSGISKHSVAGVGEAGRQKRREVKLSSSVSANRSTMSRRRALTLIAAGGGGVAAAIVAATVFGSRYLIGNTAPASTPAAHATASQVATASGQGKHILAHTSDLPLNSAKTFALAGSDNPGLLIHLASNRFVAFNSTCTHAGCAVNYNTQNKLLECPCHGAVFDPAKNAAVVQGPAPSPLAPVNITVNADGTITEN